MQGADVSKVHLQLLTFLDPSLYASERAGKHVRTLTHALLLLSCNWFMGLLGRYNPCTCAELP